VHRLEADLPTLAFVWEPSSWLVLWGHTGPFKEMVGHPELTQTGNTLTPVYLAAEQTAVLHWHGDTFDLPVRLTLLPLLSIKTRVSPGEEMGWHYSFIQRSLLPVWNAGYWSCSEIGVTPGVSVARQEAAHYIERLEAQAAKFWHAWLESWRKRLLPSMLP